jgi:hypothetical protein
MIKLLDLLKESLNEDYLNSLLEKIFENGIDSLTPEEKQYLNNTSKGINSKTPYEYLQDLFKEWKVGEIEAGNDIENTYHWSDLYRFDQELQDGFLSYTDLVKKYPNLDREDLSLVNSLGHAKEFNGAPIYTSYGENKWNRLTKKQYNKILKDEFGIKYEKGYNPDDLSYEEEFGYSFEEKQNWEKIKDQIFDKKYNFNWFSPKSLKNYEKIEDEAKQVYIDKYGPPKYKRYPF